MVSILACSAAQAQMSLPDQIAAVRAAQDGERARQDAMQRAAGEREAQIAAQQRAASVAIEQQRIARETAIEQQRARMQTRIHDEGVADKRRDQDFEDQLRALQVERAKIDLLEEQQKVTSDKQRDQAYQDKLRQLEIQQKTLEVKRAEVRASRENDFIEHDLRREDAQTDVVQSGADATRNVSEGAKSFMQGLGNATVKNQSKPVVSDVTTGQSSRAPMSSPPN
jgi:uncharacterized protein DUF5384